METGQGLVSMGSNILCRNVHTGPRQGHGLGAIVSYCASPIPCAGPSPDPVQYD